MYNFLLPFLASLFTATTTSTTTEGLRVLAGDTAEGVETSTGNVHARPLVHEVHHVVATTTTA